MNTQRTMTLAFGVLLASCGVGAWSWIDLRRAEARADSAISSATQCELLAAEILEMRERPRQAIAQETAGDDLVRRIQRAATAAGIDNQQIIRISPESKRRHGNSSYLTQSTHLRLSDVTLRQAVELLRRLGDDRSPVAVASVQLTAPNPPSSPEVWAIEATLTRTFFQPRSTAQARARAQ